MKGIIQGRGLTRRRVLSGAAIGTIAIAGANVWPRTAQATRAEAMDAIKERIGGKDPKASSKIELDVPEIAENGSTVPMGVRVDSPMTDDDHVKAVHVMATLNPSPEIISFKFTPMSGRASASTRMRLAETQNVIAVAELSDGSTIMTQKEVKVTIGGCGG
jgi:sulfur-oxidizing protein SoxY